MASTYKTMPNLRAVLLALLVLVFAVHAYARTEPMSAAQEVVAVTELSNYKAMYSWLLLAQPYFNIPVCKAVSTAWAGVNCIGATCNPTTATDLNPCCKLEDGQSAEVVNSCGDAPSVWRKAQAQVAVPGFEGGAQCCDKCNAVDTTSTTFKENCVPGFFVGATVCSPVTATPQGDTYAPGEPISHRTDCSTGPSFSVTGLEHGASSANVKELFDLFVARKTVTPGFFTVQDGTVATGEFTPDERSAFEIVSAQTWMAYAVVSTGPTAVSKASIAAQLDEAYTLMFLAPQLNGDLIGIGSSNGEAHIYSPQVYANGGVNVSGNGSFRVLVVGGPSAGTVSVTSTGGGAFYVHDFINEANGTLSVDGATDGFISSVTNYGRATFTNVIGSAVQIVNSGTIIVDGRSNVNMFVVKNTGTIEYKAGTTGDISVPDGTIGIVLSDGVTKTERAPTTNAALSSGRVTQVPSVFLVLVAGGTALAAQYLFHTFSSFAVVI
jgi:hypothetical protein